MRSVFVVAVLAAAVGCGSEIGDECIVNSDCSPNGDRQCDVSSKQGYCTIQGCDVNTCPEEAVCVRFFTGNFSNITCDPTTENISTDTCSFDELCSLVGRCVPRSSEVRYCMRRCESRDDCRDGYECRDLTLMTEHGGEPVTGSPVDSSSPKFCAPALD